MKTFLKSLLLLFLIMVMLVFTYICFEGSIDLSDMYRAKDRYVDLQAKITSIHHYVETDEGTEYDRWETYVSYEFDGKEYSDVYYSDERSEPEYGTVVDVRIDPENPSELLESETELMLIIILTPVFMVALCIALFYLFKSGFDFVFKKAKPQKTVSETLINVLSVVAVLLTLVVENIIYLLIDGSFVYTIFSVVAFVVTVVVMIILKYKNKGNKNIVQET